MVKSRRNIAMVSCVVAFAAISTILLGCNDRGNDTFCKRSKANSYSDPEINEIVSNYCANSNTQMQCPSGWKCFINGQAAAGVKSSSKVLVIADKSNAHINWGGGEVEKFLAITFGSPQVSPAWSLKLGKVRARGAAMLLHESPVPWSPGSLKMDSLSGKDVTVDLSGDQGVTIKTLSATGTLDIDLSGSARLQVPGGVDAGTASINNSGNSKFTMDGAANISGDLKIDADGGGPTTINGGSNISGHLQIHTNGRSPITISGGSTAKACTIDTNGGTPVKVQGGLNISGHLQIKANGGSPVTISGGSTAKTCAANVLGGSDVSGLPSNCQVSKS